MSNEELVAEIQNGVTERMGELWEQVCGLVKWKAGQVMTALENRGVMGCCGVEFDDLYQSGYPAMVAAVESYDPAAGAFSTWFIYYLKKAFAEATGYRTKRGRCEPLNGSLSLDKPLSDEDGSAVFGDLLPDRRAAATLEVVEEREYRRQLRHALERALYSLPADMAEVLRLRNYERLTLDEIAQRWQLSRERIRQLEAKGIRQLRQPGTACTLRPFYDFDIYSGTGLAAFRQSGMSVQERYVAIEEERRERAWRRQQAEEERTKQVIAEADRILARYRYSHKELNKT